MHIAIITAGGAGMYCGSCMHDNTWARVLHDRGVEVSLIPTYTPIRVDEDNLSTNRVFFGGINVYLEFRSKLWRKLPRAVTSWVNAPWFIKLATKFSARNDAKELGALTLSMLEGEQGPQAADVQELAEYISTLNPDVVCFSNALLSGAVQTIKQSYSGKIFCVLQGDDIFLNDLPEPYKSQVLEKLSACAQGFDGFITHSAYYRDYMADLLGLPVEKFHLLPLGMDFAGHDGQPVLRDNPAPVIGYFARICPEKGLHRLLDAFEILHAKHPNWKLKAGGYLGKRDAAYFKQILKQAAKFGSAFEYIGSPGSLQEKVVFYKSIDVFSVPTEYHEPKGLSVLESLANGVPVVQPAHGAFPEMIGTTQGGLLCEPNNPADLAAKLEELLLDSEKRQALAKTGHEKIRNYYGPDALADQTSEIFKK